VLAHASATVALMMPGRFFLGLGTGERLNEQVVGRRWPRPAERRAMVEEAVEIVRALWDGGVVNHDGRHFRVEGARLFTRPDLPPPIMVAANGSTSARLAGSIGDGLVGVSPDARMVEAFEFAGGAGKPRLGQVHACWAASEKEARETALHWWPNAAFPPDALTELARPAQLDELRALVTEDAVAGAVACGPDPERHVEAIARFVGAGFTEVYVHQVGPDQLGFIDFYRREVMPRLQ
jgi:G6PDH family F420-dependent oxidoreductase